MNETVGGNAGAAAVTAPSLRLSHWEAKDKSKKVNSFIHSFLVVHLSTCAGTIGANCQHRFILSLMRWAQVDCKTV